MFVFLFIYRRDYLNEYTVALTHSFAIKIPRSATNTATSNHFTFFDEKKQKHFGRNDKRKVMIEDYLCKFDMSAEYGWYVDRHEHDTVIPLPTTLVMVIHQKITAKSRLILVSNTFATRKVRPTWIIRQTSVSFSIPCLYLTLIGLKIYQSTKVESM